MKIKSIRALWGPNFWSVSQHQLIVMQLVLEESEERIPNNITGFCEALQNLFPGLSGQNPGEEIGAGFLKSLREGARLEFAIEHIAAELQRLAGMNCEVLSAKGSNELRSNHAIFTYEIKEAGIYAGKTALKIVESLVKGEQYNPEQDIYEIKILAEQNNLGPSTASIVAEAKGRGIPTIRLDDNVYIQLGYGAKQKKIEASVASTTSSIATELVGNKHRTKQILSDNYVPVPKGVTVNSIDNLGAAIEAVGFPLVIKPLDRNQGKGITTNINIMSFAIDAFHRAKEFSRKIIVEKFVEGSDFRVLVINYQFVAAAMRSPAAVTGDGVLSIEQLIERINSDPKRGVGHGNLLTRIRIDDDTKEILARNNLSLETVLANGKELVLKTTANLSTGGIAEDVTSKIHPSNVSLVERIARIMGLDICGIDIMAPSLASPVIENGGAVIEVNAAPGLRMHLQPNSGKKRNVAAPIINMLFPDNGNGRIPIIAVTGTNGKTTTTRLIAQMTQLGGYKTGYTATEGIYLDKELIYKGDCSGPASARVVLKDPAVEFAVLESARGGIIRSGLGFDQCDCAVVTNIAEDHLGIDGIDTIEGIAAIKSVVPQTVKPDGFAVLNADDGLAYAMKESIACNIALFSLDPDNPRIRKHCEAGGLAAVCREGSISICKGNLITKIEEVDNIPITFNGKARFNIANALAATLAAYVTGICLPAIRCSLRSFSNSTELTPGRMNLFNFGDFSIMVDYAHNPHGLRALGEYIISVPASKRIGVIAGVGDRRAEDIIALGEEAARIFDEIIIRMDANLRGRTQSEISSLLTRGIQNIEPDKEVACFSNELDAVEHAINTAKPDTFTVILVENITSVSEYLQQRLNQQTDIQETIKETEPVKQKRTA